MTAVTGEELGEKGTFLVGSGRLPGGFATEPAPPFDPARYALGFVVRVQGHWTPSARAAFASGLRERMPEIPEARIEPIRRRAQRRFWSSPTRLFVCWGGRCRARVAAGEDPADPLRPGRLPVTRTGCQGACDAGPTATLRVGDRCQMFAGLREPRDWYVLGDFARRAARAGTLLLDPGAAARLRFDPVHGAAAGPDPVAALSFLLGHFSGAGQLGAGTWFHKELVGAREAGGRFLSLRMAVTHELEDGAKDGHEALVLVGRDPRTGRLHARAHTDGGSVQDLVLEETPLGVSFEDPVQIHGRRPIPARKRIEPCEEGVLEAVELVGDGERVTPYSRVILRRRPDLGEPEGRGFSRGLDADDRDRRDA